MFNNFYLENHAVFDIMWKIYRKIEPDRPQMKIWRMVIAYSITKGTNRHSEYNVNKKSQQMQQYADIYSLQNYTTCFGCHSTHHQEYQKLVPAASGTGHTTCTATPCLSSLIWTGLCDSHKPVQIRPRRRGVAVQVV